MTVDEAVMVAGLVRALARTCYDQALRDEPFVAARPELLRAAQWRAARYGLEADLMDINTLTIVPARERVEQFLSFVRSSLEDSGEWDEISSIVSEIIQRGTGAARQREAYNRAGRLEDVVDLIVEETAKGTASV
jgi:carboxylate-amine ligase